MMRVLLTIAMMCLAGGAQALSCVPPDIARSYASFAESETRYAVVAGEITFDASRLPVVDWDRQEQTPPMTEIPARMVGTSLQADGFTGAYARDITLKVQCLGPWCAGGTSGMRVLAFVNVDDRPASITLSPCGGSTFEDSAAMKDKVLSCFRGKGCAPKALR